MSVVFNMGKKGLSLLEILIAALLMALVMTGLANVFFVGKKFILHSRSRVSSGGVGRLFVDPLQMRIRQDEWGTNNNCISVNNCSEETWTIENNIRYTVVWTASALGANLRKVRANITWTELQ